MEHVSTQLPYALTVAVNSFLGYIIFGLTQNLWISLGAAIVLLVVSIVLLNKFYSKKNTADSNADNIVMEVNK